ncbi:hypothetical protein [Nafulsella turpanensis]|uniref:hypothetical protein n=1 Tax=Nafulsella turpanensis TaxID=1265690 RepID=UPI0003695670|nr:hypothetical protein [Nafulsella turpanensis]
MRTSFFLLFFLLSVQLFAQEVDKPFDLRFGLGTSLLGSGDILTITLENELNYKLTKYFTTGLSLNYGRSNNGVYGTTSYIQGNLNVFISPFKNTRKNDFRIGTGVSLYNVSDTHLLYRWFDSSGELVEINYDVDVRKSYGYNIILEDTYSINSKLLLGLRLFTQPYLNGDINSGVLLKFGVKL